MQSTDRLKGSAGKAVLETEPDSRPLARDDREHHYVTHRPVTPQVMVTQDPVLLRAERGDGGPRPAVVPVGAELDSDASRSSNGRVSWSSFTSALIPVPWALAEIQVDPISSRRCSGRRFKKVVMPTARPSSLRRIVQGATVPSR